MESLPKKLFLIGQLSIGALRFLLLKIVILTPLLAGATPDSSALLGQWVCNSPQGSMLLVFESSSQLVFDGEYTQYTLVPGAIQVPGEYGPVNFPYTLNGNTLSITFPNGQIYTFRKRDGGRAAGNTGASSTSEVDRQLRNILLSTAWSHFSFSGGTYSGFNGSEMATHSHSTERYKYLYFYADGTYSHSSRRESSYTGSGSESGLNALYGGTSGSGETGRWEVKNGNLFASEGNCPLELIDFWIFCNSKKNVDTPNEDHPQGALPFYYVEGTRQCRCGGWPILVIEGNEYSAYDPSKD
jgi:hypothetical protein